MEEESVFAVLGVCLPVSLESESDNQEDHMEECDKERTAEMTAEQRALVGIGMTEEEAWSIIRKDYTAFIVNGTIDPLVDTIRVIKTSSDNELSPVKSFAVDGYEWHILKVSTGTLINLVF